MKETVMGNCRIGAFVSTLRDPTPSAEDVSVTKKIVEAGKLLDIEVLDHIIIGKPGVTGPAGWVSLRERGLGFGRG